SINGLLQGRRVGPGGQALPEEAMRTDPAPMMIAYGLCLIAGIVVGYAMRSSLIKGFIQGGICLTASALLVAQMVVGFPFFKTFEEKRAALLPALGVDPTRMFLIAGYTPIFYIALVTTLAAFILAVIEPAVSPRKRRRRDDDDDEDDDYDEDDYERRFDYWRRRRR